jgi:hypothetical protein
MILIALPHLKKYLGVTKQSVAYLANKTVKDAVVFRDKKKYIDISHVLFKKYYKTKEQSLKQSYDEFVEACKPDCIILETSGAVEQKAIEKRGTALDKANIITKHQIDHLSHLTVQEVVEKHSDLYNYTAFLDAHKTTLELQKLANQVCKQRGELIDAEVLTKTCRGYLDGLAGALLTDFVNWAVQEVAALTDCSKQKQIILTDKFKAEISRQLKNTQSRTIKAIQKAQEV